MGDGLHIYTREGMNLFVENVHIHREYFTNQDNWRMSSPYDSLLTIQHEELWHMCEDMKRKYTHIEDNLKAVKAERDHLHHTIAEFLGAHMPSSAKITTRTQRLESVDEEIREHREAAGTTRAARGHGGGGVAREGDMIEDMRELKDAASVDALLARLNRA